MLTWRQATIWTAPSVRQWLRALARSHQPQSQPIDLCLRHYGYLPGRFRHQGEIYQIRRVERSWDVSDGGGMAPCRYFRVRCADDRCYTLFQNLRAGTWHLIC